MAIRVLQLGSVYGCRFRVAESRWWDGLLAAVKSALSWFVVMLSVDVNVLAEFYIRRLPKRLFEPGCACSCNSFGFRKSFVFIDLCLFFMRRHTVCIVRPRRIFSAIPTLAVFVP